MTLFTKPEVHKVAPVCRMCYQRLGIVLLAVDCLQPDGWTRLTLNPADTYFLQARQVGYFIAKTHSHVRR